METVKIRCEFKKLVPVAELKPHPRNRNKHSADQITRLARLFEYQGIRHPIIVSNLSGFIVAGHGRLDAAKKLSMTEFPVDYQDFESEESEYAFLVSDNAISLWAELDLAGINNDLPDLGPDFDIETLAIKDFTIDVSEKVLDEMNEALQENKKYIIEVQFPNDMEMNDIKDDLISRGFIVRVK